MHPKHLMRAPNQGCPGWRSGSPAGLKAPLRPRCHLRRSSLEECGTQAVGALPICLLSALCLTPLLSPWLVVGDCAAQMTVDAWVRLAVWLSGLLIPSACLHAHMLLSVCLLQMANKVGGKGFEPISFYLNCELKFNVRLILPAPLSFRSHLMLLLKSCLAFISAAHMFFLSQDIENIHVMRKSLATLQKVLSNSVKCRFESNSYWPEITVCSVYRLA